MSVSPNGVLTGSTLLGPLDWTWRWPCHRQSSLHYHRPIQCLVKPMGLYSKSCLQMQTIKLTSLSPYQSYGSKLKCTVQNSWSLQAVPAVLCVAAFLMNWLKWTVTGHARDVGRSRKTVRLTAPWPAISLLHRLFCSVNGQPSGLWGVTREHRGHSHLGLRTG